MPAKTWFLTNNLAGTSGHQELSETSPGSEAYASPTTGWVVGTGGGPDWARFAAQTELPSSQFGSTRHPDGVVALSDCWRTANPYSGSFAAGNWEFHGAVRAQSSGGSQDGNLEYRLWHGSVQDGGDAVEVSPTGNAIGSTYTNLTTSATQDSNVTKSFDGFSVSNEYIFIEVGCKRTGAGGMTTADVNFRIGTGATRVLSSDFAANAGFAATAVGVAALATAANRLTTFIAIALGQAVISAGLFLLRQFDAVVSALAQFETTLLLQVGFDAQAIGQGDLETAFTLSESFNSLALGVVTVDAIFIPAGGFSVSQTLVSTEDRPRVDI